MLLRASTTLALTLLVAAGIAAAQTSAAPKQCYMILGAPEAQPGSALILVPGDQKTVHLYFLRQRSPYEKMVAGGKFADVARSMIDQGNRSVASENGPLVFHNGFMQNGRDATYQISVNGDVVSGTITNPAGVSYPISGKCAEQ